MTLIRQARLVPVTHTVPREPVDIQITGSVQAIAPRLAPDPGEQVVDAAGRWAIPGLWDTHVHLTQWALTRSRLDLSGTSGPSEVITRVAAHLGTLPATDPESLVTGAGYRSGAWQDHPTVAALDAVSGDHRVVLVSGDSHNGWLNSAALRFFGLPERTGPLEETEWFPIYARLGDLPEASEDRNAACGAAMTAAAARGIVGIVDMELAPNHLIWPERLASGLDLLRVRIATYPDRLEEVLAAGLCSGRPLPAQPPDDTVRTQPPLLTMGPLKIISDGSLNTRTAYCCEPYASSESSQTPYGRQNLSLAELTHLLGRAHAHGLDSAVHAIGDAAVSTALDAFETTGATGSIEHAQLMCKADIPRMAHLGVRASVQPAHLLDDRDTTHLLWPDRTDRCFPLRSLVSAGVVLTLGSDAPVSPLDPWLAMAAAVHRSADQRPPWNAAEALTAAQALAASTDGQGTIAPGSRGDIVLLDADPLAVDDGPLTDRTGSHAVGAHLRTMRAAATLVGGRPTHLAL